MMMMMMMIMLMLMMMMKMMIDFWSFVLLAQVVPDKGGKHGNGKGGGHDKPTKGGNFRGRGRGAGLR